MDTLLKLSLMSNECQFEEKKSWSEIIRHGEVKFVNSSRFGIEQKSRCNRGEIKNGLGLTKLSIVTKI